MKWFGRFLAVIGAVFIGTTLVNIGTAQASDPHFASGVWQLRDATAVGWEDPASQSALVNHLTVDLTKPAGNVGTSYENTNLNLDVKTNDVLRVDVTYLGADTSAGAIRMFAYDAPDSDTWSVAPTFGPAIADGSATLEITFSADATIGTVGLVYDASNAGVGTVRFQNLRLLHTNDDESVDPTIVDFHAAPVVPDPVETTDSPILPVTGSVNVGTLALAGGLTVAGGIVLLLLNRRRNAEVPVRK